MADPIIVQAVGVAVAHGLTGQDGERAKRIEVAMAAAVEQAQAEGITASGVIRERMLAARDMVE